jgi:hypothetical protein
MPIQYWDLSDDLCRRANFFLKNTDLLEWYQNYHWASYTKSSNFQDIVSLEIEMITAAKRNAVNCSQIRKIAKWGAHPMQEKIHCREPFDLPIYSGNEAAQWIKTDPAKGIRIIRPQVKYVGPTYTSKILRFSMPQEFGALDTRITRVFGKGDPDHAYTPLLDLVTEPIGKKWFIQSNQWGWPDEYGTFIFLLRYMASGLNESGICCPHPEVLYKHNLREPGIWECADVEMALFSFATERIYPSGRGS